MAAESWAYRRFGGSTSGGPPLLLLPTFRANLDAWDPLLVDALALQRDVVLLDLAGIGRSTGLVPSTVTAMARDVVRFLGAIGVEAPVDVLGHGLGGMVAQELALLHPQLVRRLVLAATAARGDGRSHRWAPDVSRLATSSELRPDAVLKLLFEITDRSQAKGLEYLARVATRVADRDWPPTDQARAAQYEAVNDWASPEQGKLDRLRGIAVPTLVACGDNDIAASSESSRLLADHLPNAWLRVYPDSGHGFLFQYPLEFATLVTLFLE
ncbi:alpha/beta hydrolase [Nocardioides conyzicola]|uniref:Alpha/beta hydrolase n=1 Tax=Nocardioides conyzicola TaxID=1651781 RepID=A0ABP8WRN9_9ACTN